jgi:hypothetical protein
MAAIAAYYCTTSEHARGLLDERAVFAPTHDALEWLGRGIYFYEQPVVAWRSARERLGRAGTAPELKLIEVQLDLGGCLDFLDPRVGQAVRTAHAAYVDFERDEVAYRLPQARMRVENGVVSFADPPKNPVAYPTTTSPYATYRDHLFLRWYINTYEPLDGSVKSIRAAFLFGKALYPESLIFDGVHVQIAVLDRSVIREPRAHRLAPA